MEAKVEANVEQQWSRSRIVDLDKEKRLPRFKFSDLERGKFLGKGGFCTVDGIQRFKVNGAAAGGGGKKKKGAGDEVVEFESREFILEHCKRSNGDARYAIKYLSPDVLQDQHRAMQGLADFAAETHFLTAIDHPNIVKLRAVAEGTPFHKSYFLVLDRLYDILDVKIPKWNKQSKKISIGGKKKRALLEERLVAAADLSDALSFLHGHNIVFRDIKAENIGFSFQGKITLFDFGLPKELHDKDRLPDGNWKLSGHTGTLRYMSPEVFKSKPYNYSVDVYSFSILLWEMMKMERAFSGYGLKKHQEKVLLGGHRQPVDEKWPAGISDIMRRGWSTDPSERPSMSSMTQTLRQEIALVQGKQGLPPQQELEKEVGSGVAKMKVEDETAVPSPQTKNVHKQEVRQEVVADDEVSL